jgi:hypothetical protein
MLHSKLSAMLVKFSLKYADFLMFCALKSVVSYVYFSNNYKSVCLFLLSFVLVQYISVVYITSANSMYLHFFALAEKINKSITIKIITR